MKKAAMDRALDVIESHKSLTLATVREDGFPQANIIAYANDGFTLYFFTEAKATKITNLLHSKKVSAAIGEYNEDWSKIKGLSLGGVAEVVSEAQEVEKGMEALMQRFPFLNDLPEPDEPFALIKITPHIMSVLNYEHAMGHADLIEL